ncbi:MAG: hypothetical protein AAB316_21640 [Bacteroidota bacterium]
MPPRMLPFFTQAVLLTGDLFSQIGWAMVALGSLFFWTSALQSEVKFWFEERADIWKEKPGWVIAADSTGSFEDEKPIWRYSHSFVLEGETYLGESYSAGKKFDARQVVFIRYQPENPAVNYIIGCRRSIFRWQVNLLLLMPLAGLFFLILPIRQNLKFLRLLKIGDFTRGKMVAKDPTGKSIREGGAEHPIFKYTFEFEHKDVKYRASCRTHQSHLVEDENMESILFDRFHPTYNLVYDAVPNVPTISPAGKMMPLSPWRSWVLFLPAFTFSVNLVFALLSK